MNSITTKEEIPMARKEKESGNMSLGSKSRQADKNSARILAARMLSETPLTGCRRKQEDGSWRMDLLLAGPGLVHDALFSMLLSCAEMLDTRLVIRMVLPSAEEALRRYVQDWPLFPKAVSLFLQDSPAKDNRGNPLSLDCNVTDEPFAEVRFYTSNPGEGIESLIRQMEASEDISWICLASDDGEQNRMEAYSLAASGVCPAGCRIDFYDGSPCTRQDKSFWNGTYAQAKLLHKYYTRTWNERATNAEILKDFQSSSYNIQSSLCSVLSIPYKLVSVGISSTGEKAAAEFYQRILSPGVPQQGLNHLIHLEHRRWILFLMTEGYDLPAREQIRQYAFHGENDQRDKKNKLHPFLCDSSPDQGIRLGQLDRQSWERSQTFSDFESQGIPLDRLDSMSLWLHQECSARTRSLSLQTGSLKDAFTALKRELHQEGYGASAFEMTETLQSVAQRMLDNEYHINQLWHMACRRLDDAVSTHKKADPLHLEGTSSAFGNLKNLMSVVEERNLYHDYKASDLTLIEVIPLLLTASDPIRKIHKPVGSEGWQNIISSLLIEPQELILYSDFPEKLGEDIPTLKKFMQDRGLDVKISIKETSALRDMKVPWNAVKSVIDVTGISAMQAFEISQSPNLSFIPVIAFRGGMLHSLRGNSGAEYYSTVSRHLSVTETFRLNHACPYSDESQNYILGLGNSYSRIWYVYSRHTSYEWHVLCQFLAHIEGEHYWKLEDISSPRKEENRNFGNIPGRQLTDAKIDTVLRELHTRRLIGQYSVPSDGQIGPVTIRSKYPGIFEAVEKMLSLCKKEAWYHTFLLLDTVRDPMTGKPSGKKELYIYDDTLLVNCSFSEESLRKTLSGASSDPFSSRAADNCGIIKNLLQDLLAQTSTTKSDGAPMVIQPVSGTEIITPKASSPGEQAACFTYVSRSVKECLMKEGNVLEAYTYYSIQRNVLVDDLKLNVAFVWDAESGSEALLPEAVTNEIDLVFTRNLQTYFVSCKQSKPETRFLEEIKIMAENFGIDPKAILICSNWDTSRKSVERDPGTQRRNRLVSERAKKTGVYYIDRGMIGDTYNEFKENRLGKYIQNIIDGKADWDKI